MNVGTVASSSREPDAARFFLAGMPPERRLLPPHVEQPEFTVETITFRATTITIVLEKIIKEGAFPHGGINE